MDKDRNKTKTVSVVKQGECEENSGCKIIREANNRKKPHCMYQNGACASDFTADFRKLMLNSRERKDERTGRACAHPTEQMRRAIVLGQTREEASGS